MFFFFFLNKHGMSLFPHWKNLSPNEDYQYFRSIKVSATALSQTKKKQVHSWLQTMGKHTGLTEKSPDEQDTTQVFHKMIGAMHFWVLRTGTRSAVTGWVLRTAVPIYSSCTTSLSREVSLSTSSFNLSVHIIIWQRITTIAIRQQIQIVIDLK